MTQRVNIQYSVKLDEIEEEVKRLTHRALEVLNESINNSTQLNIPLLTVEGHGEIDRLRLSLADADTILSDVNLIIGSYLSFKSQEMMQKVPRPVNPTENSTQTLTPENPEIDALQEKIANFKTKLSDIENDADIR